MNPKGKQGLKEEQNQIVTGELPEDGQDVRFVIITGKAPLTKLKPTFDNLHALETELKHAEDSLRHYREKADGLKKLISRMKPKLSRR